MSRVLAEFLFTTLFSLLAFTGVFLSGYLLLTRKRHREEQRLALQMRLLDRVGSAKEFGEFLATDAGRQFLGAIGPEATNPNLRMLRTVRAGIVALTVGSALVIGDITNMLPSNVDLSVVAVLSLSGGVGMLIASAVSFRLARTLGIAEEGTPQRDVTANR